MRLLSRGEQNKISYGQHDVVITHTHTHTYTYICKIYYYEAFTGPMLRELLSLQSKFSESTTLLKGYEMGKELGWSWPTKQKTHKHNCDMIR